MNRTLRTSFRPLRQGVDFERPWMETLGEFDTIEDASTDLVFSVIVFQPFQPKSEVGFYLAKIKGLMSSTGCAHTFFDCWVAALVGDHRRMYAIPKVRKTGRQGRQGTERKESLPMEPLIRINLDEAINSGAPFILDLGCGRRKKPGRIGIDRVDMPHVDIVADIDDGLGFLPAGSVDEIHCRSVLEHVTNFERLLADMVRVLKPEGKAHVYVPHFSNPYYYSDYTHRRFFGFYSFYYFVDPSRQPKRKVPTFYSDVRLDILSIRLVFRSPFPMRRLIRKMLGHFFNCHRSLQEFYEEMCCYIIPCDGIEVVFTPA